MKRYFNHIIIIAVIVSLGVLSSCEDPVPDDYVPDVFVEAYLIVDEPINDIYITLSQPISSTFNYDSTFITDALVRITGDGKDMILDYMPTEAGESGYFYPDSNYRVKPETQYEIEIITSDGNIITGETITPKRFTWSELPPPVLYYPEDTLELEVPDSLKLRWESSNTALGVYGLSILPLDTAGYAEYLFTDIDWPNRRIMKPWLDDDDFLELSRWTVVPNTEWPIVWRAFRWFGWQEFAVWSFDYNMLRWFLQNGTRNNVDPLLTSVKGNAWGAFGSASVIRDTTFLIDNLLHQYEPDLSKQPYDSQN